MWSELRHVRVPKTNVFSNNYFYYHHNVVASESQDLSKVSAVLKKLSLRYCGKVSQIVTELKEGWTKRKKKQIINFLQPGISFLLEINNHHLTLALFFFFFPLEAWIRPRRNCKVTSVGFTTSVIILCVSCDPLKPSHQEGRQEIWPLQKLCSFHCFHCCFQVHEEKHVVYVILTNYSSNHILQFIQCAFWTQLYSVNNHVYRRKPFSFFSCKWKETDPGKLIATCFICLFSCNIFLLDFYFLYVFLPRATPFACVPTLVAVSNMASKSSCT